MSPEEITQQLVRLDKEVKTFKEELARLSWYMRGGVTILELLHYYSFEDRESMYTVIKENLELTKDTQMPLL